MSRGEWKNEVLAIAHNSFKKLANLDDMGLLRPFAPEPFDGFVCAHVRFAFHLMGNRAWSRKLEFEVPPTRYVSTLDANAARRDSFATQMTKDFSNVIKLEQAALRDVQARELRRKIYWLDNPTVRMPYLLLERGRHNPLSPMFQQLMACNLEVTPDSRIIEDWAMAAFKCLGSVDDRAGRDGRRSMTVCMIPLSHYVYIYIYSV